MVTSSRDSRTPRLHGAGVLLAAVLVVTGCSSGGTGGEPPAATEQATLPESAAVSWQDVWDDAFGEDGEDVDEIDGVAEDFPAEIPLPDGELVVSVAGDRVWEMIFETDDAVAEAERLRDAIGEFVAFETEGPTPDDGEYWVFLDEVYLIQVQMQPGPMPPAAVALTVVRR